MKKFLSLGFVGLLSVILVLSQIKSPQIGMAQIPQKPVDAAFNPGCHAQACALETPNDSRFPQQYSPQRISAPAAWDVTHGSSSVVIAILDTGIDCLHEDIAGKCLPGHDFISNVPIGSAVNSDDHGHGTHVTSIAAGVTNNGVGVAGICWLCQYMPVKVLDSGGGGTWAQIAAGIRFATDNGAHIINMSLGGTGSDGDVNSAVDYAFNRGVLIVSACGNNSFDSNCLYPASYSNSMAVSCTDSTDTICDFSSRGTEVDISAPGLSVLAAASTGFCPLCDPSGYRSLSGTSMSTPHVVGVAGLIKSIRPTITVNSLWGLLEVSSDDRGPVGWDTSWGAGRLNALKAVTLNPPSGRQPRNPAPPPTQGPSTFTPTATRTHTPAPSTFTPTPPSTPTPIPGKLTLYLHNNPSPPNGDTFIQTNLPMDTNFPISREMYNYAADKHSKPGAVGRYIQAAETKETAIDKLLVWRSPQFTANRQMTGVAELTIYVLLEAHEKGARVKARLAECTNSMVCQEFTVATSVAIVSWAGQWNEMKVTFTNINRLIDQGNRVHLFVQLDKDVPNSDPGLLGYDASFFEAKLVLP